MSSETSPLTVAIDVGPLYGHRTGVGVATAGMVAALGECDTVRLDPFLVSGRSRPDEGHRRLPLPGIAASHLWSRSGWPNADRWLDGADVVHGTNYVAPPSSRPTVVSVYDCWFLRHPELASPVVRRAGSWLTRLVRQGAWIHTSSSATTDQIRELFATERVVTIHLGEPAAVSTEPPARPPDGRLAALDGAPFAVSIATEGRRKGLPLAIEAFERLADEDADLRLVLAGAPGDDAAAVSAAIDAATPRARRRIVRLGPVDEPTKRWLLARAAVIAYPTRDEGFGFPILEENAARVPVVASAVGSVRAIAGGAAALVDGR